MLNLPIPPKTLVTRQIRCVSCRELFTVSVDTPVNNKTPSRKWWHVPADKFSQIQIRYLAQRDRHVVIPEGRAESSPNPERFAQRNPNSHYLINCPRCGADNRNWLNIKSKKKLRRGSIIWGYLLIFLLFLLTIFLIWYLLGLGEFLRGRTYILLLVVPLAGLLPLWLIPKSWYEVRVNRMLNQLVSINKNKFPSELVSAFVIAVIFLFVLPLFIFAISSLRINFFNYKPEATGVEQIELINENLSILNTLPVEKQKTVDNAFNNLYGIVDSQFNVCEKAKVEQVLASLEAVNGSNPDLVENVISELKDAKNSGLVECRPQVIDAIIAKLRTASVTGVGGKPCGENMSQDQGCKDIIMAPILSDLELLKNDYPPQFTPNDKDQVLTEIRNLIADPELPIIVRKKIDENVATLDRIIADEIKKDVVVFDGKFSFLWFLLVGLSLLVGISYAYISLNERVSEANDILPPLIFSNLANMTRVALWELQKTLELPPEDVKRIQWTTAERNSGGGIHLVGFYRGLPQFDVFGTRKGETIPAQKYEIQTNPWVKIEETKITDEEVPQNITTPTYVTTLESWPHRPNATVNPENNGGGSILLSDSNQPPISEVDRESRETGLALSNDLSVVGYDEDLEYQPPTRSYPATLLDEDIETFSEAGQLKLVQVNQFKELLCQYFSFQELRDICLEMSLDPENFPSQTKVQLAKALIMYCSRRGLHVKLMQICNHKRPNVNWALKG